MSSEESLPEEVSTQEVPPEEGEQAGAVQGLFSSSGILQLVELEIPGKTGPVPSGEWGINFAAAIDNYPLLGLQLFVPAWPRMGQGDSVAVLLGGDVATSKPIAADEVDTRQTLFIAPNRLRSGPNTISYRVTRVGQISEDSAPTDVLVKLERPGGQDTDPGPGHSELTLSLPQDIINDGVDKAAAAKGVPVTIKPYPFMAEYDEIWLSWGGVFVIHTVTQAEVGNDIVIIVDEATILEAGDSERVIKQKSRTGQDVNNGGLAIAFKVYDLVANQSEDWSPEIRVVVDTGGSRLAAGIVKEAENNVLDLENLNGGPATLQIVALPPDFAFGDEIIVSLMGTSADGKPIDISYAPQKVVNVPSVIEIPVPNADVRRLAKSQAGFRYQLRKADGTLLQARGRFVSIVGEPEQLAAPVAKDAVGGGLDPQLRMTTIEVAWDETMAAGYAVTLIWWGTKPDLSPYFPDIETYYISYNDEVFKQPIVFHVDGEHLRNIEGGTVVLSYELFDNQGVGRKSLATPSYNVGPRRAELPAPEVKPVQGNVLDPEELPLGYASMIVKAYARIAIDDWLHISWVGSSNTEKYEDKIPITPTNIKNAEFIFRVLKKTVDKYLNGTVDASYWVVRAGGAGTSQSDVLTLQIGKGQEQVLDPVTVAEEREGQLDLKEVSAGANVTLAVYPDMGPGDVVYLEWTDDKGNEYKPEGVDISGSMVGKPVPFIVPYAEIVKNLNNLVTVICRVELVSGQARTQDLTFRVHQSAGPEPELEPVTVDGVVEGNLDLRDVREGAKVTLSAWLRMEPGDVAYLEWTDNRGNTYKPEGRTISGSMVGKPVVFTVPYAELEKNENNTVTVICRIEPFEGGELRTRTLSFAVTESAAAALPAPAVAEANAEGVIDPNSVTAGATVVIGSEAGLLPGDKVRVVISGKAGDDQTHSVMAAGVQRFKVGYAVIRANENSSIELQCHVQRGGSGPAEPSPPAEYDVRVIIGGGRLRILGARFNRSTYRSSGSVGIAGLTDIIDVASNWHVFAAVRANGSVVAWGGTAAEGGVVPDAIADLTNVVQVTGSSKAFAVLCRDGTVKAWGDKTVGGDITPVLADLVDVQAVYSNTHGFVALRRGGRVVTWGHALGGGDSSAVRGQLDGFVTYRASSATRGRALSAQRTIRSAAAIG